MKNNENPSQDWLQAAEATFQKRSRINLGERVEAKLISKAKDSFYLDLGQRFEGVISKIELTEEDQKALLAGESITFTPRLSETPSSPAPVVRQCSPTPVTAPRTPL